jgi:hypothetical protein
MWVDETREMTPHQLQQVMTENELFQWLPNHGQNDEAGRRKTEHSRYGYALKRVGDDAVAFAVSTGADAEEIIIHAFDIVSRIQYATKDRDQHQCRDMAGLQFWHHRTQPVWDVTNKMSPDLFRPELEALIGQYLSHPFRCTFIDRTLADVLVALEFYAFADEAINRKYPLNQSHPMKVWLGDFGLLTALLAVIAAFCYIAAATHLISAGGAVVIFVLFALLWTGGNIWSTVLLPVNWSRYHKYIRKCRDIVRQMDQTYREFATVGPVSVHRLRDRLKQAEDEGVSWPSPLYALLDDVAIRTGRL